VSGVTDRIRSWAPEWLRASARLVRSAEAREDARHELRRRMRGEPALPEGPLRHLLVLCHGNICRSPFAETLLAARLPAREVRSAGLHAGDGKPRRPVGDRVRTAHGLLSRRSIDRRGSAPSCSAGPTSMLVMQGSHVAEIARRWPQCSGRVRLLGDFLPDPPHALPDPYGHDAPVFDRVFARLRTAVDALAARVEERARSGLARADPASARGAFTPCGFRPRGSARPRRLVAAE
jgi:protein-tyrosine phosphatase